MNLGYVMARSNIYGKTPIFLDFEANKAGHFYLGGFCLLDGIVEQYILDEDMHGLGVAKELPITTPFEFTRRLLEMALNKNGFIVGYSTAEQKYLNSMVDELDIGSKHLELVYLDLRKSALKWVNRYKKASFEALPPLRKGANPFMKPTQKKSLASIMRLTDFLSPSDYAPGSTTKRFNDVRNALVKKGQKYENLTSVQKQKGTKVLKHNCYDVEALPHLFKIIHETNERHLETATSLLFNN